MSNQAVLQKFKSSKATTVNDTTRRLAYSAGVPMMTMNPATSGLPQPFVPGGQLIYLIPQTRRMKGIWNDATQKYSQIVHQLMPGTFAANLRNKFQDKDDHGYRNLDFLTSLPYHVTNDSYRDEAEEYFNVVHPRITCSEGLERDWVSSTEGNVGAKHYQACPTCRLADLQSQACSDRIFEASNHLDSNILMQLRETLIDACQAAIRFAERRVQLVDADIEKRANGEPVGRTTRNEADYIYLKMLHRSAPKKVEPSTPESIAAAVAKAVAEVKSETKVDPEFELFLAWKKQKEEEAERQAEIQKKREDALAKAREAKKNKETE